MGTALAASTHTSVSGVVTVNGPHARYAHVVVTCNGHERNTTTDRQGYYSVDFSNGKCPSVSPITVSSTKGSASGESSYYVKHRRECSESVNINVQLVDVAVPEFGWLESIGAAIASGVMVFTIRRRHPITIHQL
jgi:hypothetical protein